MTAPPKIPHPCDPAAFEAAGRYLYGARWQSALGRALLTGYKTTHNWLIGRRAIPGPVVVALRLLIDAKRREKPKTPKPQPDIFS